MFHADASTVAPDVAIDITTDLAHLAYTGGTTGRSKGVQLPHRNVVVNALQTRFSDGAAVNIDVEMANLLTLQSAYGANARVMSTVKEMFEMLLSSV